MSATNRDVSSDDSNLAKVCLAISSYRNDTEVLAQLESLGTRLASFGRILIVDSLGTDVIPSAIAERGWTNVDYRSFDHNLGSAGNLASRLRLSAAYGVEWVYAINHDGDLDPQAISRLVSIGEAQASRTGAVYPLRRMFNRGRAYDVTGRYRVPFRSIRTQSPPRGETLDVYWSSSNGALYSLGAVRAGLEPWDDLWMGYEDLGYGWLLHRHGYRQLLALKVEVQDRYEYQRRSAMWLTDKASWYAYYHARNFIVVARRTKQPLPAQATVLARVLLEFAVTLALRDDKARRLRYVAAGSIDGLRGKTGKWRLP